MESPVGERLELLKTVENVGGLVLGRGRHVVQLHDVAVLDAECEDLHARLPKYPGLHRRVAAVREAVCEQEYYLVRCGARVLQDFLIIEAIHVQNQVSAADAAA